MVVAIWLKEPFYAVYDIQSGALIQTIYNTTDIMGVFINVHLAPNGKIVTDCKYVDIAKCVTQIITKFCRNLTVYDASSPMLHNELPVYFAESGSAKFTLCSVKLANLSKFAEEKLGCPFSSIQHSTFFA